MTEKSQITIALADDHVLFRSGLVGILKGFEKFEVIMEASTGEELLTKLRKGPRPDIILLDLNMPGMSSRQTIQEALREFPKTYILILSTYCTGMTMLQLLHEGVRGFVKKEFTPMELYMALQTVWQRGYFHHGETAGQMVNIFNRKKNFSMEKAVCTEMEIKFLKQLCTEKPYKEIAIDLKLSKRSVESLRESLFNKLGVRTRVGLVVCALQNGLYTF